MKQLSTLCLFIAFVTLPGFVNAQCVADAGTHTVTVDSVITTSTDITVCTDECISFTSNNDFTLPPPVAGESAELMYAIYTCPPTPGLAPENDSCYSGVLWTGQDFTDCNDANSIMIQGGYAPVFYLVPITTDDGDNSGNPNGIVHYDSNGDSCYVLGQVYKINYDACGTRVTEQASNRLFNTYPNPTTGMFTIDLPWQGATVDIYSVHGQLLRSMNVPGFRTDFDLTDEPQGTYILRVSKGNWFLTSQVVKLD